MKRLGKRGIEMGLLLQIIIWGAIIIIAFLLIRKFIIAPGPNIPGESMLTP